MAEIIDFHAHLGKVLYGQAPLTVENVLRFMDEYGIGKSVVLPLVAPEEEDYYYTTEQALTDCAKHPDRLIPFANMDPRRGSNDGNYDFYSVLKEYSDMGCRGFGEILANLRTNDVRMKGIYKACGQLGFPIVFDFRSGKTTGVNEPAGMPYLEQCLVEFPETTFVAHGPAWWAEMSADATEEVPGGGKSRRIDYLLGQYPNLYADLSARSAHRALTRDKGQTRDFLDRHYRKLLFGTDRVVEEDKALVLELLANMDLSSEAKRAIFRGNAEKLLSLC